METSLIQITRVLLIKPTKRKKWILCIRINLLKICNSCLQVCDITCISCTWMHCKELPTIYSIHPCLCSFIKNKLFVINNNKEQNVDQSCYISFDIFWNSKSIAEALAYFSVRFSVKQKLPTVIGDMRVKIIMLKWVVCGLNYQAQLFF